MNFAALALTSIRKVAGSGQTDVIFVLQKYHEAVDPTVGGPPHIWLSKDGFRVQVHYTLLDFRPNVRGKSRRNQNDD